MEALLAEGRTPSGRKALATKLDGINESQILHWCNRSAENSVILDDLTVELSRADLMRIKGVGEEWSDLLEASGVDTVQELKQRRADNLHQKVYVISVV